MVFWFVFPWFSKVFVSELTLRHRSLILLRRGSSCQLMGMVLGSIPESSSRFLVTISSFRMSSRHP